MSPRQARALLEAALDEVRWPYVRRLSLLLDALIIRGEDGA